MTIDPNYAPPPSPEVDALTRLLMRHRDDIMTTGPNGVREVRAAALARHILDAANYLKALDDAGYELLPATFRAGYAEAVARLRDDDRYRNWWTAHPEQQFGTAYWAPDGRQHLAAYLETVGPDGPDVTSAAREEG